MAAAANLDDRAANAEQVLAPAHEWITNGPAWTQTGKWQPSPEPLNSALSHQSLVCAGPTCTIRTNRTLRPSHCRSRYSRTRIRRNRVTPTQALGALLESLCAPRNALDRTLVVIASDHGSRSGEHWERDRMDSSSTRRRFACRSSSGRAATRSPAVTCRSLPGWSISRRPRARSRRRSDRIPSTAGSLVRARERATARIQARISRR